MSYYNININIAEFRVVLYFTSSFPSLLAFDVGGLGFEFCVFVAGWRHALQSEWPFIIIIIIIIVKTGQPSIYYTVLSYWSIIYKLLCT